MNLEQLKKFNPDYDIKDIYDSAFKTYGKIHSVDVKEAIEFVRDTIISPQEGTCYNPDVEEIKNIKSIKRLSQIVYGYMDVIAGSVSGHNQVLNGIEYHQCSETIIAVTDFVLVVGHIWDLGKNTYNSNLCEIFYVPKGTVVECYSTTLHYTPISISDEGFQTICLLLEGTGDVLPNGSVREGILKKKNKWFIAHRDNYEKVESGDFPGLTGEMIYLFYNFL